MLILNSLAFFCSQFKGAGTKVTIQFIKNPTNNKEKKTVKVVSASDVKREVLDDRFAILKGNICLLNLLH